MGVLPAGRLGTQQSPQGVAIGRRRVFPIGADGVPTVAQSLLIRITVLRNDRGDPLRMPRSQSKTGGSPVIKYIDCEAVEPDGFGKSVDDARDVVEGIFELTGGWHIGLTETGEVRRYDVEAIGQQWNQIPEHVTGAREAMEQQQLGRVGRAALSIKDLQRVDFNGTIFNGWHDFPH